MRPARPVLSALALLLAFVPPASPAVTIRGGVTIGWRGINDARITAVYHPGAVYTPGLEIGVWKGLFFGIAYETAAPRTGTLGLDRSPAEFGLTGFELTAGWELRTRSLAAYGKAGCGFFHYRQTIADVFVQENEVDATAAALVAAAGLRLYIIRRVFLSAEIKFVPLKVRPFDQDVDLGGWRFAGGLGFSFDF